MQQPDWWFSYVRSNDVVLDVGANVGETSKLFLEKTKNNGLVYAVEPSPACFAELQKLCGVYAHLVPINCGVGTEIRSRRVFHYRHWTLLDVDELDPRYVDRDYHPGQRKDLKDEFEAEFRPLDSVVCAMIAPPTFVKIDVDGAAYDVLASGESFLKMRLPILVVEIGSEQKEHKKPIETLEMLHSFGYTLFSNGGRTRVDTLSEGLGPDHTRDVLCIPEGR